MGDTLIQRWNNKIRALRKHTFGWTRHKTGLEEKSNDFRLLWMTSRL
jgi:hypothetical protein